MVNNTVVILIISSYHNSLPVITLPRRHHHTTVTIRFHRLICSLVICHSTRRQTFYDERRCATSRAMSATRRETCLLSMPIYVRHLLSMRYAMSRRLFTPTMSRRRRDDAHLRNMPPRDIAPTYEIKTLLRAATYAARYERKHVLFMIFISSLVITFFAHICSLPMFLSPPSLTTPNTTRSFPLSFVTRSSFHTVTFCSLRSSLSRHHYHCSLAPTPSRIINTLPFVIIVTSVTFISRHYAWFIYHITLIDIVTSFVYHYLRRHERVTSRATTPTALSSITLICYFRHYAYVCYA